MNKISIESLEEMKSFSKDFLGRLNPVDSNNATIILLFGNLGSGKTTFVQNCARVLGITENVNSPTFIIQKRYGIKDYKNFKNLMHIDTYRLNSSEELEKIGFKDLISDPENIIFIEWPEKIESLLPKKGVYKLNFKFIDENTREVSF